ncbi:fibronectin type III domain-containing protein [Alkalispirochaeta sphaeroplastigenens]|uniref:fibronectin type III domain-containing protein n=1 Tax=Alkalispirochaeta sphaeroplastigenens TaxID=1187066 RepID=UPI0011AF54FE|nr:fibronectin type III domain-containing protein [Alkalispirochaeta sphaeroplastigenens]
MPSRPGANRTGTLEISFNQTRVSTVLPPEVSLDDLEFNLTLTPLATADPDQEPIEAQEFSAGNISLPGIPEGTWNISLRGYFPEGTPLEGVVHGVYVFGASSQDPIEIAAGLPTTWEAQLLAIQSVEGTGSVEINLFWDPPELITGYHNEAGIPAPSLQRLRPGQTHDEPVHIPTANIDFDPLEGTLRYHRVEGDLLQSGFYRIVIPLRRQGIPVATYRDVIHIYDGRRSEKTLDITGRIGLPPSAPENLQVTQGAFDPDEATWAVNLSWTRTADTALGYRIYRREAGADEFGTFLDGAGTLPANSSLFTDRVPPDSSWDYRVVAYNTYGESPGADAPSFEAGGVFTVTYLGGDGSSGPPPGPVYLMAGADPHEILHPQTLRGPGLTGGHEDSGITQRFLHWLDESDISYQPGDILEITSDITLTANWTEDDDAIGKVGPAGGLVFFDIDVSDPLNDLPLTSTLVGWRYLEISLEEIPPLPWIRSGIEAGDLENLEYMGEIGGLAGLGRHNTAAVITAQGDEGEYAALAARNYAGGGFHDWFLPSEDELTILDVKIFQDSVLRDYAGIENNSWFWHSNLRQDGAAARYFSTESGLIMDPPLTQSLPSRVIRGFAGPDQTYIVSYDPGLVDEDWGGHLYMNTDPPQYNPPRFHSQGASVTIPDQIPFPGSSSFLGWQEVGTDSPMDLIAWDGESTPPTFTMPGRDVLLQGQWAANLVIFSETLDGIFGTGTPVYYDLIDADTYTHEGSGWGSGHSPGNFTTWYEAGNVQLLGKDGAPIAEKTGTRPPFVPEALTGLAPDKHWRILLTRWDNRGETPAFHNAALSDPFTLSEGVPHVLDAEDFVTWDWDS